jgi:hypothetical protein
VAIVWFSDEDRQRMRDEERLGRLWREFEDQRITEHFREASCEPLTPFERRMMEHGFQLDPRSRRGRGGEQPD